MMGEATKFRKKAFGGFNQDDVVNYISNLANERNEALSLVSEKDRKIDELTSRLQTHDNLFAEIDAKNKEIAELNLLVDALRIEALEQEASEQEAPKPAENIQKRIKIKIQRR